MIVVFSGPPCSGKSVAGDLLAVKRRLTHLEMDAIRLRLLPDSAHTRRDRMIAYRAMHLLAEMLACRGESVIVNAGYSHAEDRCAIEAVAARAGGPLYLVEFKVSPEVAVARSRARRATHPGLDLTDRRVAGLVTGFPYFGSGLVVDGETRVEETMARIEEYLERGTPLPPGLWTATQAT